MVLQHPAEPQYGVGIAQRRDLAGESGQVDDICSGVREAVAEGTFSTGENRYAVSAGDQSDGQFGNVSLGTANDVAARDHHRDMPADTSVHAFCPADICGQAILRHA